MAQAGERKKMERLRWENAERARGLATLNAELAAQDPRRERHQHSPGDTEGEEGREHESLSRRGPARQPK